MMLKDVYQNKHYLIVTLGMLAPLLLLLKTNLTVDSLPCSIDDKIKTRRKQQSYTSSVETFDDQESSLIKLGDLA
jgi:hypothetical protein